AASERVWQGSTWTKEVEAARITRPASWEDLGRSPAAPLHPLSVCAAIQPRLEAGGILVSDGGEFGQWRQAALEASHRLIGGQGERVERADELTPALERATRSGRPACVDVVIDGVAAPSFSGSAGH